MNDTYLFYWHGPAVPKARPRSNRNGRSYLPENYRNWKEKATECFAEQKRAMGLETITDPTRLYVFFQGKHSRQGDAVDNYPGAIIDALVDAKVIRKDNAMGCPGSVYEFAWSKKQPPIVIVAIAPYLPIQHSFSQLGEILTAVGLT